jgi:hypothetical protein
VVFSISGEEDARQYLKASQEYLKNPAPYRRMRYPFPSVRRRCLLCGTSGCSRWKGYYVRNVVCTLMGYAGPVAIHLAQCRTRGVDYTYWPSQLIPYLQPSRNTLESFYKIWISQAYSISAAVDEVVGRIKQEYFIAPSVAYQWLKWILRALLLNHETLGIRAPESIHIEALRRYSGADVVPLFDRFRPWRQAQRIVFAPPRAGPA